MKPHSYPCNIGKHRPQFRSRCVYLLRVVIVMMAAVCVAINAASQAPSPVAAGHPELLVSTQWLADHLKDPSVLVVQVGRSDADYRHGHIPGAQFLPVEKIADIHTPPGTELLPAATLQQNLEEVGIGDGTRIVIYTTDYDPIAARLFFTLDYLGHGNHAALLDGSIDKWMREKRPISTETTAPKRGKLTIHEHPEVVAKLDWVTKIVTENNAASHVAVIDARPAHRYREGHLPGAKSMYWQTMQTDHALRAPGELRQMFAEAGSTPGGKVVSYCEVGQQASYTYWVARYLGMDAAMYDGSYTEWSSAGKPVVQGDEPR